MSRTVLTEQRSRARRLAVEQKVGNLDPADVLGDVLVRAVRLDASGRPQRVAAALAGAVFAEGYTVEEHFSAVVRLLERQGFTANDECGKVVQVLDQGA